uniref:Lipase_3 domain-containing protein n=1 Tax=Mesocestoides corti TaxID=53468 RepID=A0A5K3FQL9_MESCO
MYFELTSVLSHFVARFFRALNLNVELHNEKSLCFQAEICI